MFHNIILEDKNQVKAQYSEGVKIFV